MKRTYNLTADFDFRYELSDFDVINTTDFFHAVDETSKIVYNDAINQNINKMGLCLSGSDSELIAHYLNKNSIPVEYFFLLIKGVNDNDLKLCEKISKKYSTPLNVIEISLKELLEIKIFENFEITMTCWPTYVTIPSLIKEIPNDYYIILGEGDLEKTSDQKYKVLFENKIQSYDDRNFYIPVNITEVAYRKSLDSFNKTGESNFFSKNFNLWYHILKNPELITNGKYYYDPKSNILKKFMVENNFLSPGKTLNYTDNSVTIRTKIISELCEYGKKVKNWNRYAGDIITIPKEILI
jgi:hypothetical protein